LDVGELFEILGERARNRVERAVRLTRTGEVNVRHTVGVFHFAVAGEAVEHKGKTLIAFHTGWTLEEFIKHSADDIA
jgi:hypothetical protein